MKRITIVFSALMMLLPVFAVGQTVSCDVNSDGEVNIADVNYVIGVILDYPVASDLMRADVNRDGEVNIADVNMIIQWILSGPFVTESTCADVIAGPEGEIYRVTGVVDRILNTQYGNWYLSDETGEIYIYGTLDADGNSRNFMSLGIGVGDTVTVEGPKDVYNNLVELVDVTVIRIKKAQLRILSHGTTIPAEGGTMSVLLYCGSGNGVSVEIPDEAQDWLNVASIADGTVTVVTFNACANNGYDRSTQVVFKSTDNSGVEHSASTTVYQNGSIIRTTVADFLAAGSSDTCYSITGVLQRLYDENGTTHSFYIRDYTGEALVYEPEGFTGAEAKVGDIITVVGNRGDDMDSPMMVSSMFEELTHVVTPVTIAEFLDKEDDPDTYYMITGVIDEVLNTVYGNLYLRDGDYRVYVYGTYPGWGALGYDRKYWLETAGIEVGDQLSVIGVRGSYRGTPQLANGIYFSHEKAQ